tara:strand:+ start:512 stop:1480 length:969 start_codon:yes stop_codon:yes gene_type:complete
MANYNVSLFLSSSPSFGPANKQQNITVGDTLTLYVNNGISGTSNWNAYISSSWSSGGTFTPMPHAASSSSGVVFTSTGAGNGLYQINLYAFRYSPFAYRQGRVYGSVSAAAASYTVTPPSTIQEGTTGTVNLSASNHTAGTVWWAATPSADFSPNVGTAYVNTSGTGSFSLSPIADNTTEGNETGTIRVYSNSARTAQIASNTFTIIDQAATGGGGGGTGGGTTGGSTNQGINVFSPNGTKVFGTDLRTQNVQYAQNVQISGNSTSSTFSMADANDPTKVLITLLGYYNPSRYTINTTSTGFSITNNTSSTQTAQLLALRIG